ncbi:MAG: NAD(P)-dependent alcohol dehydrogenase, partial [Thermoleophilia bacterium]|nr:NAD(P)-dependent alcohol dehydrogenase [Thermoleophilia bacterium]
MKAAVRDRYGSPDVVELREIEKPVPADDEVLVRVRAASVNPADWYGVTGRPYVGRAAMGLRKPKSNRLGVDFAGTVEAVGKDVTQFRPGDEVFGGRDGAFAEYVCVREERAVVPKPANVTFEEAAAVPVAALTALQGLRDKGQIQPGHRVLINGASGGVGTFAVQIAKALGAEVTGVCSTRNVDLVRSLGADHVVDYTQEDFTRSDQRYELLLDVAGSRSWRACRRVLTPQATLVIIGAPKGGRLLGPLSHIIKVRLAAVRSRRKAVFFIAKLNKPDLEALGELLAAGKVTPVIDRRYELSEVADAFRYLGEGH